MKYLDRTLIQMPIHFALCRDEKAFNKEMKRLKVPKEERPPFLVEGSHATVHHFENQDDGRISIVCLGTTKGRTREQVYGLLVHEAVHIWQEVRKLINEKSPSSEFEAYAIQNIAQALMEAV